MTSRPKGSKCGLLVIVFLKDTKGKPLLLLRLVPLGGSDPPGKACEPAIGNPHLLQPHTIADWGCTWPTELHVARKLTVSNQLICPTSFMQA